MRLIALELHDFQSHKRTRIELSHTITTIRGPTDVGKSAVLRALRWVSLNDIAGDEFIREGQKETVVILEVQDAVITRTRGSRENTYQLDGEEFKAFGTDVPQAIKNLLLLSDINFQGQHDGPFWFDESAPEVSRRLNAIIDLSIIDQVLSNIAAEVRLAQERRSVTMERLEEAKTEYAKAKPQLERIEDFDLLIYTHAKHTKATEARDQLDSLGRTISSTRERVRSLEEQAADGAVLVATAKEAFNLSVDVHNLNSIATDILLLTEAAVAPPPFDPVEALFEAWKTAKSNTYKLDALQESIRVATSRCLNARERLNDADVRYHKETEGRACPLCGNEI